MSVDIFYVFERALIQGKTCFLWTRIEKRKKFAKCTLNLANDIIIRAQGIVLSSPKIHLLNYYKKNSSGQKKWHCQSASEAIKDRNSDLSWIISWNGFNHLRLSHTWKKLFTIASKQASSIEWIKKPAQQTLFFPLFCCNFDILSYKTSRSFVKEYPMIKMH